MKFRREHGIFFLLFVIILYSAVQGRDRNPRLLSLFNVVRFSNDVCNVSSSRQGTCYTAQECENKGGTNGGTCANGYGVCCVFSHSCGETTSENCTYFEGSGFTGAGECTLKVCKACDNICQIRLDLDQFTISGPSTDTTVVGSSLNGNLNSLIDINQTPDTTQAIAKDITGVTRCNTDTFVATSPGSTGSPVVCGDLLGDHMYLDASDSCNILQFQFGATGLGVNIANRRFIIKITQYSCDYPNLAPSGCLQYFFGSDTGELHSFNFAQGSHHLANQRQTMCIRRERGQCRLCLATQAEIDFILSGATTTQQGFTNPNFCCAYGNQGQNTKGYDCLQIVGAEKEDGDPLAVSRFCGRSKGLVSEAGVTPASVCTSREPFQVNFYADGFEFMKENAAGNIKGGFRLAYMLRSDNCNQ